MAALAQLAEQVASSKNGSAEPHLLRPLPFLIYLADGDTVRGPSLPPHLFAPLLDSRSPSARRSLAVPSPLPRRHAAAHPLPSPTPCPPRPSKQGPGSFNVFQSAAALKPVMRVFKRHPEVGCSPPPEVFQEEGESNGAPTRYTHHPTPPPPPELPNSGKPRHARAPLATRHYSTELPLDPRAEAGAAV